MGIPPSLTAYRRQLEKWLPNAKVRAETAGAIVVWHGPRETVKYFIEVKAHLEHQDVRAVAEQLRRKREPLAGKQPRLMVAAPYVRREQGAVLEQHDIDYFDLAGNAHLRAPGLFIHVEGLRPTARRPRTRSRMTRGWAKTVLALLVRPALVKEPYRQIARVAGVAPATVMTCLRDLRADGLVRREAGAWRLVDTQELLSSWTGAYAQVLRPKLIERSFQMRAPEKSERWEQLRRVLAKHQVRWTLTGADAAFLTEPHLRTDVTEIYCAPEQFDARGLLRELQAQPAVSGNLQVIESPAPIALATQPTRAGAPLAPLVLVYAELRYHDDDQSNEAAELLLPRIIDGGTA